MLQKLRIQNFKGWKDTGELPLAPITVFFGGNSSGKSSIGQFLMMLKQNPAFCDRVQIHCTDEANQVFKEFPDHAGLIDFDVSDRKFVATANAHPAKPAILQAVDGKWAADSGGRTAAVQGLWRKSAAGSGVLGFFPSFQRRRRFPQKRWKNHRSPRAFGTMSKPPWPHAPPHWLFHQGAYFVTASTYHRERLFDTPDKLVIVTSLLIETATLERRRLWSAGIPTQLSGKGSDSPYHPSQ